MPTMEFEVTDTNTDEQKETTVEETENKPQDTEVETGTVETADNEDADTEEEDEDSVEDDDKSVTEKIAEQDKADADTKTVLEGKGIAWDKLADEYTANGKLSEDTYTELEKAGFPATVVNAYIAGKEAINNQFTDAVYKHVGGKAEYDKLTKTIASKGQSEVDAYNALIESGNLTAIKMALDGVKASQVKRTGTKTPAVLGGGNNVATGGYENISEMEKAMNDSKYGRDAQYTQSVQDKVAKSTFIKLHEN